MYLYYRLLWATNYITIVHPAIGFEVGHQNSRGQFLNCSHLAIAARLHFPKRYRINESLLYRSGR